MNVVRPIKGAVKYSVGFEQTIDKSKYQHCVLMIGAEGIKVIISYHKSLEISSRMVTKYQIKANKTALKLRRK